MMTTPIRAAIPFLMTLAASPVALANPNLATGACTDGSDWIMEARRDGARVEVEFEVESFVAGEQWRVFMRQNRSDTFARWTRTSVGEDGYFWVERSWRNNPGDDLFEALAVNRVTGEVCLGSIVWTR